MRRFLLLTTVLPAVCALGLFSCGGDADAPASGGGNDANVAPLPANPETLTAVRRTGAPVRTPGLESLPSGVEFEVISTGTGDKPPLGSVVAVHQTAWTVRDGILDREIIDSRSAVEPVRMLLATEAPGSGGPGAEAWSLAKHAPQPVFLEGLVAAIRDMRRGERRWVVVPHALGYGALGFADVVGPDVDLAFDIELVGFDIP